MFFLVLALFLFYAGALLGVNAGIHYAAPPAATEVFANCLLLAGLVLLPGLLVHAEVEYAAMAGARQASSIQKLLAIAFYLPFIYFGARVLPRLITSHGLEFLWTRSQDAMFFGLWLGLALAVGTAMEIQVGRRNGPALFERIHHVLVVCFGLLAILVLGAYGLGVPRDGLAFSVVGTILILAGLMPGAVLGYFTLRHNFLQIGMQRNLVYAVSAAFLALLYLALVRRLSGWFEPVLPPEATAAILLFLLVFTFEPLERMIGRALYRSFQERIERTQRLVLELQDEARDGDLTNLICAAERRIQDEFSLSAVRLSIPAPPGLPQLRAPGGLGHCVQVPLKNGSSEMGLLEACSTGAVLVGETTVALEFLAEQLPALVNHCRIIQEKLGLERDLAARERLALVGQMAASISHNLRNPLGSVKTVLQVLLEDRELAPRVRQDCELVVHEIDRLAKKLTQLLRYAKPSILPGEGTQGIALVSLTKQIVSLLRLDAENRGVQLDFNAGVNETTVQGFEETWRDVVSNLVINAMEAQPSGGRVCITIADSDSIARVEISDEGPGISADQAGKIFQPFFTTKPSGTGLGLAIAARHVAEMGGEIRWESPVKNGRGTKFIITVPSGNALIRAHRQEWKGSTQL
ncbi:MAG TPA: ATP-binding protein [Candidatus Acidoferrales bacterium]|nr:ATP-binding protein [Candidatus Acidoferrales bacterium]